jgi:hypothetical protein
MSAEVHIGDSVRLRKKHPCGSSEWTVVRLGLDIGLTCQGCQRKIMIPRTKFNKFVKPISSQVDDADGP